MHTRFFGLEQRLFGVLIASYSVFVGLLVAGHEVVAMHGDPILYMEGALDLFSYESRFHPPLYSAAIAIVKLGVSDIFVAAKLVAAGSAITTLCLTWSLGRLCFGSRWVGLLAAVLVALSPAITKA